MRQGWKTKHPNDVPVRVDTVKAYKHRFKGWKHFLNTGMKKAANVVDAAKMIENIQVLAFLHQRGSPINVFFINIFPGTATIKNFCNKTNMTVVRTFRWSSGYDWKSVIERYGSDYGNHEWLVKDVNQLFFDIQMNSL